MELKGFYEEIGADYKSVLARFGNEQLIYSFLKKYFDKNEYDVLENAVTEKNWDAAFICAHNMKGIGLNLSLTELSQVSSVLCEALRAGEPKEDVTDMLSHIRSVYERADKAFRMLEVE